MRRIEITDDQSELVHDDGALQFDVKNQFLEKGQSEIVVKFTNLESNLIKDLPETYKLKVLPHSGMTFEETDSKFNSRAGGMAVARPYGFEIDFVRNAFSGSAA